MYFRLLPNVLRLFKKRVQITIAVVKLQQSIFQVRHPRCVSNKSNYKAYAYIVKRNYVLGGMVFTICKAQLHVSATNVGHLQVVK